MSIRTKRYDAFYQFMEPFLAGANKEEIEQAKKEYRKKYKAQWRRDNRKDYKELTIQWDKNEYQLVKTEAQKHKLSVTRFVKQAALAYINKNYLVLNYNEAIKIMQLLALIYNRIEELHNENILPLQFVKTLQLEMNQLEKDIRLIMFSPKTIEKILADILIEKPNAKTYLINFIENFQP